MSEGSDRGAEKLSSRSRKAQVGVAEGCALGVAVLSRSMGIEHLATLTQGRLVAVDREQHVAELL